MMFLIFICTVFVDNTYSATVFVVNTYSANLLIKYEWKSLMIFDGRT